ncbi:MAG: hypothetical protein CM15mP6_0060 [Methanobacteriota archaeon]|nr:MAG: hypothetical protein CM15mP6_0060 [Euryarchaeota archaeon]
MEDFPKPGDLWFAASSCRVGRNGFKHHGNPGVFSPGFGNHVPNDCGISEVLGKKFFYAIKVIYANQMYDICQSMAKIGTSLGTLSHPNRGSR